MDVRPVMDERDQERMWDHTNGANGHRVSDGRDRGQWDDADKLHPWVVATKVRGKYVMASVGEIGLPWHRVCPVAQ